MLKSIGRFILCAIFLTLSLLPFLFDIQEVKLILYSSGDIAKRIIEILTKPFQFAGPWNIIALVVLISSLLITFSLFDLVISQRENKRLMTLERITSLGTTISVFIFVCHYLVYNTTVDRFLDTNQIEGKHNVILLGTSRTLASGGANQYYIQRLEAVFELYQENKIKKIYITGDKTGNYNEPMDMTKDLVKAGIPLKLIQIDTAGYRTLDSILRLKEIFGVSEGVVISQDFHLKRALFLCWYYGINAIGLRAGGNMTQSMAIRETLAIPKLILDTMVLNTQPRTGLIKEGAKWHLQLDDFILILLSFAFFGASILITYMRYKEYIDGIINS